MADFEAIMRDYAASTAIAFIDLTGDKLRALGSGVLVRIGQTSGVLTCGHVLKEILARDEVGLCTFPYNKARKQNGKLSKQDIGFIECLYEGESADGPDIAFFEIANVCLFESLEATSMVFDLIGGKSRYNVAAKEDQKAIYVVPGILEEWTKSVDQTNGKSLDVEGINLVVTPKAPRDNEEYDILTLVPSYDESVSAPSSYGGLSGSGFWELLVKEVGAGEYKYERRKLSGVVYWEELENEEELSIFCHGPKSIYEVLLPKIIQKTGQN